MARHNEVAAVVRELLRARGYDPVKYDSQIFDFAKIWNGSLDQIEDFLHLILGHRRRYQRKPMVVEVVEIRTEADLNAVAQEGIALAWDPTDLTPSVYNQLRGIWIEFKLGDFLRIDRRPQDVYPIDRETFLEYHEPCDYEGPLTSWEAAHGH